MDSDTLSTHESFPLISCIMPTHNRRSFIPRAIAYFLRQDYPNKGLIIVDDRTDATGELIGIAIEQSSFNRRTLRKAPY